MRRWSRASGVLAMAVGLLAVVWASGCGYALAGRGNTLPASIKIIGIPLFVNHSQTGDIDQVLTRDAARELTERFDDEWRKMADGWLRVGR